MTDAKDGLSAEAKRNVFEGREFPFTHRDFRQIAQIMHADAGIALPDVKAPLVYSRLVKRLRVLGVENFKNYCALVSEDGDKEREHLVAALTTNVTRFFREPHHFEHLKTKVLPPLVERVRNGESLRIWSAGCSSGEEAYSIALCILALMPDAPKHDVRVLATDISGNVLTAARRGIFGEAAIAPVSRQLRADWFTPARTADGEKVWRAGEDLRLLVGFRELNLIGEWPMRRTFQAIFCRNVAIYFEPDVQGRLWSRLTTYLAPGAYLYIGHSERVTQATLPLKPDGNTIYRLISDRRP
jgi:chemotaxis protein methyltransferase CheR